MLDLIHNNTLGYINQYGRVENVYDMGSFDFSILGSTGRLLWYPRYYKVNDYELKKDFEYLYKGVFKPFDLPKGLIEEYIRNAEEDGYVNPMTKSLWLDIKKIQEEEDSLLFIFEDSTYEVFIKHIKKEDIEAVLDYITNSKELN